jgi:hypothetical protein
MRDLIHIALSRTCIDFVERFNLEEFVATAGTSL